MDETRVTLDPAMRAHSLVHRSPLPLWALDERGFLLLSNLAFKSWMSESTAHSVDVGQCWFDCLAAELRANVIADVAKVMRGASLSSPGYVGLGSRQIEMWPLRDANDQIVGVACGASSASDNELHSTPPELEQHLRSVATLAAGVAHEINNPLMALLLNLEALGAQITDLPDATQARDLLQECSRSISKIQDAVGDLRTFASHDERRAFPVGLAATLEKAVHEVETLVGGVRLRLEATDELVVGNEENLRRAMTSIILNAAEAALQTSEAQAEVRIGCWREESQWITVEVTDNGPGMPARVLRQAFDPFFTTKPANSGLGLSIAQRLVAGFGGQVSLTSSGHGVQARIRLRLASERIPESADQRSMPVPSQLRVLIVDDEPLILRSTARALSNHEVTVASSGRAALAALEMGSFDVVLCDLVMPGLNGLSVLKEIRRRWPELEQRVIFMTGGGVDSETRSELEGGGHVWMLKPFGRDQFERQIRKAQGFKALRSTLAPLPEGNGGRG